MERASGFSGTAPAKRTAMPHVNNVVKRMRTSGSWLWLIGLALALVVGIALFLAAAQRVEDDARIRFDNLTRNTQYSISARVKAYSDQVRGVAALFQTSDHITRLQFHQYVSSLEMERNFPALLSVNFVAAVPDAQRAQFIDSVRADVSMEPAGYPHFTILPPGERRHYAVLTYLEPMAHQLDRFGVDIAANPAIARALDAARDSGQVSASGQPVILHAPEPMIALGMRLPVYRRGAVLTDVASRRAAHIGSVGVAFSVARLVQGAIDDMALPQVRMILYADSASDVDERSLTITRTDRLLYSDNGAISAAPAPPANPDAYFESVLPIDFNGTLWKALFRVRKADLYSDFDVWLPWTAFGIGFSGSLLIYAYFHTLHFSRRRAVKHRVLLDSVLNNVDAQVSMKDEERRYIYANAKMADVLGMPVERIVGRTDRELMPTDVADAEWETDRQVFADGMRRSGEDRYVDRSGEIHHLWTVKVPLRIDKRVTAVIALSTDITALHNLKEQAQAANRAKSDFLSNMSHEIRTPMNSIIGMAHLALKSVTHPKQRDYLQKIYHSGQHLLGIINDILDFSKIEAGKLDLEVLDFELAALLANISSQLGEEAARKNLELVFDVWPGVPQRLRGDPLRLEQVLLNFTSNAIKFSERGRICIRVQPVHDCEPYAMVRFEVEDKGIGMSAQQVAQLFRSFHQADTSTTRKYGGTGLGLVISKQLAELMGGSVGVDSEPGQGSTFWFTARLMHGAALCDTDAPDVVQADVLATIRSASILLVEDNVFSQQVGQELLEDVGASVCVANNGQEALDLLEHEYFDCVLMDVQMPVMDGFETTRRIRANPRLAGILIVAMTANAGCEDQARCIAAGMDEFVTKPIAPHLLFKVLAHWIRQRAAQGGRPPVGPRAPAAAVADGSADDSAEASFVARLDAQFAPAALLASEPAPALATTAAMASVPSAWRAAVLFDVAALGQTFNHKHDKMRKYAVLFLDSARDGLLEVEQAMADDDLERLAELGHRIKSSARAVGAMRFGELCLALETFPADGDPEQARRLVAEMAPQLALLRERIDLDLAALAG